jgi:putative mRNA 3-end processing factor
MSTFGQSYWNLRIISTNMDLIEFTNKGMYCAQADIYIDPWKPVPRALITHGHGDHARWGHKYYLCTNLALPVIRYRLGVINIQGVEYGEKINMNGVDISFHPAGHIIGSAQIRLEYKGQVWVVSGDYKTENDGLSTPFESIKCHAFITESTFGLPVYKWVNQDVIFNDLNNWWADNNKNDKNTVVLCYALGKAQRILQNLDMNIGNVYTHGTIENVNEVIRKQGIPLNRSIKVGSQGNMKSIKGALILATPGTQGTKWMQKFSPYSLAVTSGWMDSNVADAKRKYDKGFVLSDHADWEGLNMAVKESGADRIFVTHGYTETYSAYLRSIGLDAKAVKSQFFGESVAMDIMEPVDKMLAKEAGFSFMEEI